MPLPMESKSPTLKLKQIKTLLNYSWRSYIVKNKGQKKLNKTKPFSTPGIDSLMSSWSPYIRHQGAHESINFDRGISPLSLCDQSSSCLFWCTTHVGPLILHRQSGIAHPAFLIFISLYFYFYFVFFLSMAF
ncbi:hypothetical protein BDW60DRAFT_124038 [Aspergillus nidulans var. acristatus]